jgi:hypothetical protein
MTLVQVIPTRSRHSEEGLKAKCRCEWRGWISHCIVTTLRAPSVVSDIGVGWCWSSRWHRSPGDRPGGVGPKHWGHTGPILMSDVPRDLGVRCIPRVLSARRAPPCSENQGGSAPSGGGSRKTPSGPALISLWRRRSFPSCSGR